MTKLSKENPDSHFFDMTSQKARIDFQIPTSTLNKLHTLSTQTGKSINDLIIQLLNQSLDIK